MHDKKALQTHFLFFKFCCQLLLKNPTLKNLIRAKCTYKEQGHRTPSVLKSDDDDDDEDDDIA